jgi:hypothetical protein
MSHAWALRLGGCQARLVIPTAIFAGFLFGLWFRWWTVPVVAVGWAFLLAVSVEVDPGTLFGGAAVGAVNGLLGLLPALAVRRLVVRPA